MYLVINLRKCSYSTLETRRELRPKCIQQLFVESLLETRQSAIGQFFPLSLVTVPEVFEKVNFVQFVSLSFLKW